MSQPWKPKKHQLEATAFAVGRGAAGLLLDPGLGKTSVMYATYKVLRDKGLVDRALVIAPRRPAQQVWPAEAEKWSNFSDIDVEVLHGPKKLERLKRSEGISVINPEGLPWLFSTIARPSPKARFPWQMLIVDESTRFKHTNTMRFRLLRPWLKEFRRRYILTGSPAPNGLMDLFGQAYLLDMGAALGPYITNFRNTYFDSTGYGGYTWVPKEGAEEAIYKRLAPLMLRMKATDYLDLPPVIYNTIEVELPPAARKVYRQMEKLLLAEVEGGMVVAANVAAAAGKCRQIVNGGIYTEPGKSAEVHGAKVEALLDLLEELSGTPALIAYEFAHDKDRIQAALKKAGYGEVPYIGGGVSDRRFKEIETAWNAGLIPALLAQPQSVAHGLNLQGTKAAVVWFSTTWNLEDYEQFIRRVWRQGQQERVFVHHIVAKDTIDEAVMLAIGKKDMAQRALLSALKEYGAGR